MKSIDSDNWQDLLPQVLQIAGIGIWELFSSSDGLHMRFSSSLYNLFGYERGQIQGKFESFARHICHPDFQEDLQRTIDNAIALPDKTFHFEFQVWSEQGKEWRWVYAFGKALPPVNPADVRILGGVQDIHERRAVQKQLERSQQEALQTVELQKVVLEQQVQEQTGLLRAIQNRVDSILDTTSPVESGLPLSPPREGSDDDVELLFAASLHKTFDIITAKMDWYKAVIDSIPFPISVTDLKNHWMYLNAPGLAAADASTLKDVFGLPSVKWSDQGECAANHDGTQELFSLYHKKLNRFFQGQGSGLFDNKSHLIGHIETMQDVTDVHEADERTRLMLDAMPLGCNFWDRYGNNIDCNQAVVTLFELPDKKNIPGTISPSLSEISAERPEVLGTCAGTHPKGL